MQDRKLEKKVEIPVHGMDCAGCARHVGDALRAVPGVRAVEVLLGAERAVLDVDPAAPPSSAALRAAVHGAGYTVPGDEAPDAEAFGRRVFLLLGLVFGAVLSIAVLGEGLGFLASLEEKIPAAVGVALVLFIGYPVFASVVRAALKGKVIAHTLMAVGAVAALLAGTWTTAAVVVFFMRVGDFVERFTTARARRSVQALAEMAPRQARVVRGGAEHMVRVEDVRPGEVVVVRPGEQIPVDGDVVEGAAAVDQAAVTGESVPVAAAAGTHVYAATYARGGSLRIRTTGAGQDTTFGRIIRLVEEAEAHRGPVQRLADRFSAYYLPVVAAIAVLTYLLRQDVMAVVAVLVVACSCAFALATPVALLASIGAGARRGLLVKGGRALEALARADVVLLDKTGTLTRGRPRLTDVVPLNGLDENALLSLAAAVEHDAAHPLADAVRDAAVARGFTPGRPDAFEALPGLGVRAQIRGKDVAVGNARLAGSDAAHPAARRLEAEGKALLFVTIDGALAGLLAAADTVRPEVADAVAALRRQGLYRIELLTGDHERAAAALADPLGLAYRAGLLPEDKIAVVREYQARGHTVVMVGDGINDAPALAQADVGIAMGVGGTDVAMASAHVALLRDDWGLVPVLFALARRTMRVVRLNILFTAVYNVVGLSLAAVGLLPPMLAAAAQSLPDLGILANSARLLRPSFEKEG